MLIYANQCQLHNYYLKYCLYVNISQAFFAYTYPPSTNNSMSDELTFKLLGTSLKCSAPPPPEQKVKIHL